MAHTATILQAVTPAPPGLAQIFHRQVAEIEVDAEHLKSSLSEGGACNSWTDKKPRRLKPQDRDTPLAQVDPIRSDEGPERGTGPQRHQKQTSASELQEVKKSWMDERGGRKAVVQGAQVETLSKKVSAFC